MARDFWIDGEVLVTVDGQELGLADSPIRVTPVFKHRDIVVDAWGEAPPEVQWMLGEAYVNMNLVNIDRTVLDYCIMKAMGGAPAIGQVARAGTRMFSPGNMINLKLTSPQGNKPWSFLTGYMTGNPAEFPMGTAASVFALGWRFIPATLDPWQGGVGAQGQILWQNTA